MTTWQQRQAVHVEGCDLCRRQLARPQPFHGDLCHTNIHPDGGSWDDAPVVQCPHLAEPGARRAKMCARHLEGAREDYARWVARTAPLN